MANRTFGRGRAAAPAPAPEEQTALPLDPAHTTGDPALDAAIEESNRNALKLRDGVTEEQACQVQGDCGRPGVRCEKHQAHLTCRVEIDGWGEPKPGFEKTIATVEAADKVLDVLRWLWTNGCDKERPSIEAQAKVVKAHKETLSQPVVAGTDPTVHRTPPDVVDHVSADQHLARLRGELETTAPDQRHYVEAAMRAIEVLRPLLPERSTR